VRRALATKQRRLLFPPSPGSNDLRFSVTKVDFGALEKGTTCALSTTFKLTNYGSYTMAVQYFVPSGFKVSGMPSSLGAGQTSSDITISVSSTSSTGTYSGSSNSFSLSVYAKVADAGYSITMDPTSKDLGKLTE